jgi:hypothetical protein
MLPRTVNGIKIMWDRYPCAAHGGDRSRRCRYRISRRQYMEEVLFTKGLYN